MTVQNVSNDTTAQKSQIIGKLVNSAENGPEKKSELAQSIFTALSDTSKKTELGEKLLGGMKDGTASKTKFADGILNFIKGVLTATVDIKDVTKEDGVLTGTVKDTAIFDYES